MIHRIAILGDFNPIYSTHHALNDSAQKIAKHLNEDIQFDWISTDVFNFRKAFKEHYSGLWIAPGSPYKDMQNVLNTITYTRENEIPTFGNCGGFQHMIIEFARNVCGLVKADHEEVNPAAEDLVISKLSCSLIEQEEELTIIDTDSTLSGIMQVDKFAGRYYCSYGLNQKYVKTLQENGLVLTAQSVDGQIRAFELRSHPFFIGTLFQPALTSALDKPNPIIVAFIEKCLNRI